MSFIELSGDEALQKALSKIARGTSNLTPLHKRFGVSGVSWVSKNFQKGGSPKWKPLSPNTVASRRGGGAQTLRDRGTLWQSFSHESDARSSRVGSPLKTALWHNEGTKPYKIRPKSIGGRLAFMTSDGLVFRGEVNHPGLPIRRMLPTREQAAVEIQKPVADMYLQDLIKKSMGGS